MLTNKCFPHGSRLDKDWLEGNIFNEFSKISQILLKLTSGVHRHLEGQWRKLKGHLLRKLKGHLLRTGTLKAGMSKVQPGGQRRPGPGTEF